MASVELRRLSKAFGKVEVIHGIDISIAEGEFVALVGPSGCGKSTLLRIIAGLEEATSGDLLIDGRRVNDLTPHARNIAMVFQSYALYPHMTVAQNMGFNLKLAGLPKAEQNRRIQDAARLLEIGNLLDRRPSELSGGQRQRVAMGRAIVRDPAAFLFDEPLSNLDAKLRVQMRTEIKALHQKVRTTSVYVTHDQIEAMTLADRIVVLNKGRIEQMGSPMELYERPANTFVAGFIGSPAMNFVDATVDGEGDRAVARLSSGAGIPLGAGARLSRGQPITLGLRPEHIVPADGTSGDLSGLVQIVEPTGAQTHIAFDLDNHRLTAVVEGGKPIQAGSPFNASVEPTLVHVFDRETGARLSA